MHTQLKVAVGNERKEMERERRRESVKKGLRGENKVREEAFLREGSGEKKNRC